MRERSGYGVAALWLRHACSVLLPALVFGATVFAQGNKYQSLTADVNGVRIHYLKAGTGKTPLVLLHGFGDTSRMWIPLFADFGQDYTVIAPDLRGLGDSSRPPSGYDKKTAAVDIHELVKSLGYERIDLVGHDIGLMLAYAYAAQYPNEVNKLALLEAPIPGMATCGGRFTTTRGSGISTSLTARCRLIW